MITYIKSIVNKFAKEDFFVGIKSLLHETQHLIHLSPSKTNVSTFTSAIAF